MTLEAAYKQFLAAPNPAALAEHASLHYITTLTTFNDPANILKHLKTQANQIKKKKDNFLDTVEGQNALAAEVETTLEFISSGGTYLPGLDSNFISDRTVTFPIVSRAPRYSSPGILTWNLSCRFTLLALIRMGRLLRSDRIGIKGLYSS